MKYKKRIKAHNRARAAFKEELGDFSNRDVANALRAWDREHPAPMSSEEMHELENSFDNVGLARALRHL